MLRHEASATDETDASCLSMTAPTKRLKRMAGLLPPMKNRHSFPKKICKPYENEFIKLADK